MRYTRVTLALLLFAAAALAVAALPASAETEPNNPISRAEIIGVATTDTGDCSADPDFVSFYTLESHKYNVSFTLATAYGASVDIEVFDTNQTSFLKLNERGTGYFAFNSLNAGRHYVSLTCLAGATTWSVNATDAGPSVAFQGTDEVEHNDEAASATTIAHAGNFSGAAWALDDPVDFWTVTYHNLAPGLRLRLSAPSMSATLRTVDSYGALAATVDEIIWSMPTFTPYTFAVQVNAGGGNYTLDVELVANASVFFAGPDEVEPNNRASDATTIHVGPGDVVDGTLDASFDTVDYIRVNISGAAKVSARFLFISTCYAYCPSLDVLKPDGTDWSSSVYAVGNGRSLNFTAGAGGDFVFKVTPGEASGNYTITVSLTPSAYTEGQILDALAANASGAIHATITAPDDNIPVHTANLQLNGDTNLYGKCIWAIVRNNEPVTLDILFPAGLILIPDETDVDEYVVTRDQIIEVPGGTVANQTLFAVIRTDTKHYASFLTFFDLGPMATGALANVTRTTAGGNYSPKAEVIAVWAGVNGMSRADIESWGADPASINEAGQLLAAAGVASAITAAPTPQQQPPGQQPLTATPVGGGVNPLFFVGGVLFALITVGAVARASARKKRVAAAAQAPPPGAPYYGAVAPPTYGYASYPGVAPLPPMAPPFGVPPPMAPPPAYGPRPPVVASVAPPVAAPPVAAAPAPAALPATPAALPAMMSNCPQCSAAIPVNTPKCPACGLDIAWS